MNQPKNHMKVPEVKKKTSSVKSGVSKSKTEHRLQSVSSKTSPDKSGVPKITPNPSSDEWESF
ncbi:hypothetical protein [Arcobacter sp. FWKO B]|uniref:hypothetical protein n=1 Tax=Arcobacter sp. FWKO B TaxID=2593672 RepID=UPI0018A4C9EB|nr:hypothetical protein [Arcobacter sp. FWKO B]QOG11942.1 hypothetical protein FWKOB_04160 [Arcobacter sp. FWKO B]